jgi:hypothetical protein
VIVQRLQDAATTLVTQAERFAGYDASQPGSTGPYRAPAGA